MTEEKVIEGINWRMVDNNKPFILWLHGYTMNNQVWNDIWSHLPQFSHLAPDLPNHGKSCSMHQYEGLPDLARKLGEIALAKDTKYVIGLSFGGIIGLQIAIEFPNEFTNLILNSSPIGGEDSDPAAEAKNLELLRMHKEKKDILEIASSWVESPPEIFTGIKKRPKEWTKLYDIIKTHQWSELSDNKFATIAKHPQTFAQLKTINYPVHFILGEEDMMFVKRTGNKLKKMIPDCRRSYLEDCGHLAILEKPEALAKIIGDICTS